MPVRGTEMPSTSSVIATAITPSENDSIRLVPMGGGSPGGRAILSVRLQRRALGATWTP